MIIIEKLLSRSEPFKDESLIGYMIRLCEDNFTEMSQLFELIEYDKVTFSTTLVDQISGNSLRLLSELTNREIYELENLKMFEELELTRSLKIFMHTKTTKICPICLKEEKYHRKI